MSSSYLKIIKHYEKCYARYGDSCRGMDWPNAKDTRKRYKIMLELMPQNKSSEASLLDFGCGVSHLYQYMKRHRIKNVRYAGLDLSEKFIHQSEKKYPKNRYYHLDLMKRNRNLPKFDYIVMNGVFTEKVSLSQQEMWLYFKRLLKKVFLHAKKGIAFNVMSHHVDWKRRDLFHVPHDKLAEFLIKEISREFVFRNDYGLYEYTTYVYRSKKGVKRG